MPSGDGTGPVGTGSTTGKGMGHCTGHADSGFSRNRGSASGVGYRGNGGAGRGFGFCGGKGNGRAGQFNPIQTRSTTLQEERDQLLSEEQFLNEGLRDVQSRLSKLEAEKQS